eukprot:3452294-Prymnesium_polylepis.1
MVGPDEVCMMVTGWESRERSERGFLGPASAASGLCVLMDAQDNHLAQHNIHQEIQSPLFFFRLTLYAQTVVATSSDHLSRLVVTTYRFQPSNPLQERSSRPPIYQVP